MVSGDRYAKIPRTSSHSRGNRGIEVCLLNFVVNKMSTAFSSCLISPGVSGSAGHHCSCWGVKRMFLKTSGVMKTE